jgi:hypothetical protein
MLNTSRYFFQVEGYLEHFPAERILILDFDALRTDPQATMDRVVDFLGLEHHPIAEIATRNDAGSVASMPRFVQRAWRSRTARRLDRFISRDMRNRARRWLSTGPRRPDPEIGPELRTAVAERLAEDATRFRGLSGMDFPTWQL